MRRRFSFSSTPAGIFYALTYVVMFALPLFGLRDVTPRPPLWLQLASWSGLLMTLLYIVLSVFPIIKVESVSTFAFKIILLIVGDEPRRRRHPRFGPPTIRSPGSLSRLKRPAARSTRHHRYSPFRRCRAFDMAFFVVDGDRLQVSTRRDRSRLPGAQLALRLEPVIEIRTVSTAALDEHRMRLAGDLVVRRSIRRGNIANASRAISAELGPPGVAGNIADASCAISLAVGSSCCSSPPIRLTLMCPPT